MKKWNKVLKCLWSFFEIVIVIYVVLMTTFIVFKNKYGYTQINNYTFYNVDKIGDKNNSRLKKGNLVIIENTDDIKIGDMIYYYAIYDESYIVRSDTVKDITVSGSDTMYVVHRDGEDVSVFDSKVLGKKGRLYHHLGTVLTIVCSRIGFLLLVFLPITIVFLYQIYDFITVIRHEKFGDKDDNEEDNGKKENEEEDNGDDEEPVIIESYDTREEKNNKNIDDEKISAKTKVEKKEKDENGKENLSDKTEKEKNMEEDKKENSTKTEIEKKEDNDKKKDEKKDNNVKTEVEKKEEDENKKGSKKETVKKEKNKTKDDDIEII